jgi:phage shock protein PspC (stress-responsive transcriptional regulator)
LLQALYQVALHTATGVVGVVIAATLSERPLGDALLAWARMALAVAALRLCVAINLPLTQTKLEEVLIGVAVYLGVTLVLFRRPPVELFFLWATHAALWLITYIGAWIDVEAATAIVQPK